VNLQPLLSKPIYKQKVWGGRTLSERLGKPIAPGSVIGESWELSGYGDDTSTVADGPLAGRSIAELVSSHADELLGGGVAVDGTLPLLYKFIDAHDNLSVQVHPDDRQAVAHGWGHRGKTECWYIVHADPGAQIIVGLRDGVTLAEVERGIAHNTLGPLLNCIPIAAGDCLFIPAGTVHAILKGTLVYEVQETSDITLRLYDWGRLENGKPRALHVKESLMVIDTSARGPHKVVPAERAADTPGVRRRLRASCSYFTLEDYLFDNAAEVRVPSRGSFQVATVVHGEAHLRCSTGDRAVRLGDTVLIPAVADAITLRATQGAVVLVSGVGTNA
jgi:mannose-6-phosphate isomerase